MLYVRLPADQAAADAAPHGTPPAASEPATHGEETAVAALVEMTQRQSQQLAVQAETIAELRERVGRAETAASLERERRLEAEREVSRLRGRRWFAPWTW